jgi:hypothetical protein
MIMEAFPELQQARYLEHVEHVHGYSIAGLQTRWKVKYTSGHVLNMSEGSQGSCMCQFVEHCRRHVKSFFCYWSTVRSSASANNRARAARARACDAVLTQHVAACIASTKIACVHDSLSVATRARNCNALARVVHKPTVSLPRHGLAVAHGVAHVGSIHTLHVALVLRIPVPAHTHTRTHHTTIHPTPSHQNELFGWECSPCDGV